VPPPTPEMRLADPGLILVEPYKELPVDRNGFLGEIPQVVAMEPCDNFPAYTARKLYIHNCGHACLAYLGYLKGYEFGYEALADAGIFANVRHALDEAKAGIVAHYGVEDAWLEAHIRDLLWRFSNRSLGDTVFRLGRDPLRKLAPDDRLVGPARLAEQAGLAPDALALSIAAACRFAPPEDPIAVELQQRIAQEGLPTVLEAVSEIKVTEPLGRRILQLYEGL
jgi:mannitol-1-phosphate 5-dehydrogenase